MIKPADRLNTVKEYYFSKKLREIAEMNKNGANILNLGIGSPDLLPPQNAIEKLCEKAKLNDANKYQSYKGIDKLREAWVEWYNAKYGVLLNSNTDILPLMGSKEGIMHLSMAFLNPGDEVLIPDPAYPTYTSVSQLLGAKVLKYNLVQQNNWLPDFDELEQLVSEKTKLIWVNYPHMPTGTKASKEILQKLVDFATKHQILLVNDNPYSFINNTCPMSILAMKGAKNIALELNSLSKSHNMAGWRQGVLVGEGSLIQHVLSIKSNFDSGMYLPAQHATAEALNAPNDWYAHINKVYKDRQRIVFEMFDALNCVYDKTQTGMFVWAKIPSNYADSYKMADEVLDKHKIFITPGAIFGENGKHFVRISLSNSPEDLQLALRKFQSNKQSI